jgi:hypothetical protein
MRLFCHRQLGFMPILSRDSAAFHSSDSGCVTMHRKRHLSASGDSSSGVSITVPQSPHLLSPVSCRIVLPRVYQPPDSHSYKESALNALNEALKVIIASPTGECRGRERLFRTVQNLCILSRSWSRTPLLFANFFLAEHGDEAYRQMQAHYHKHCHSEMQTLHESIDRDPLEAMHSVWTKHCRRMKTIISVYMYLDRSISKPGTIASVCKDLFRNELLSGAAWPRTIRSLMDRFKEEREGIVHMEDDTSLIREVVDMTRDLNLYEVVENEFLKETKESVDFPNCLFHVDIYLHRFYEQEGNAMCSSNELDVVNYLEHVHLRLNQESFRIRAYMQPQTLLHTIAAVEQKLVAKHLQVTFD